MEYSEDTENNVAYLRIQNVPASATILFRPTIFVDLDAEEDLVGIEVIDLEETFPFEDFFQRFPVSDANKAELVKYFG